MSKSTRTPATTHSPKSPTPAPVETLAGASTITLAEHHSKLAEAYSLGADCVRRLNIMLIAARALAKNSTHAGVTLLLLKDFLGECQHLSEDCGGMIDAEQDSHKTLADEAEGN